MRKFSTTTLGREYRSKRYRTELPTSVNGIRGVTHNVSVTGLYILQNEHPEAGSRIDFVVDLGMRGGTLQLCCEGEVVRVDKVGDGFGIGIKILSQVMKTMNESESRELGQVEEVMT
jgi:hypothetical protein